MKFVLLVLSLVPFAKCDDDLSGLIDQVFDDQENNGTNSKRPECTCVPYYLCENNKVVTDGTGLIDIRGKDGPCESYLDVCCEHSMTLEEKVVPQLPAWDGCGKRNPEGIGFRITGDTNNEAQFGEFPWMVAVLRDDEDHQKFDMYQCGGALIHPRVVVTAAHCVNPKAKGYKIRAGEWDTQTTSELYSHQDMNVASMVIHEEYYSGALYNDVALLFLEEDLRIGDNVDVLCLPNENDNFDYENCFASGWGKDFFGKESSYQVILKKVELSMIPHDRCEDALKTTRLGPYFKLHRSFVCAGGEQGKDTCKGDGGSPLVCPIANSDRYAHAGIVSWGIGCGEDGVPGVYANVASFRSWMDNIFTQNSVIIDEFQKRSGRPQN